MRWYVYGGIVLSPMCVGMALRREVDTGKESFLLKCTLTLMKCRADLHPCG